MQICAVFVAVVVVKRASIVTKMNFMGAASLRKSNYFSLFGHPLKYFTSLSKCFSLSLFFLMCLIANAFKSHFVQLVQLSDLFISVIMVI